ncbi:MAG: hypothetical protein FJ087_21065, partial [Deltaproteobacteria bacterium]|nr:hypothetical protein [Deltaproteobacteria bacterium]
MATSRQPVPVLLAYDIDPSWEQADLESVLDELRDMWRSLEQAGHTVVPVPVGATGVRDALAPFEPDRFVVLNWIESLPGVRHGDVIAAAELEEAGYTYTGPAPQTIALSWDKPRVKRVLERAGVATPRWRLCSTPDDVSGWDRFPAIVKPAYEHCSIGVTRLAVACSADELTERVGFVLGELRQPALVEE